MEKVGELPKFRKNLNIKSMLKTVREHFTTAKDTVNRKSKFSLSNCLMSGLAIFCMKCPSLLQFDEKARDPELAQNLKNLFEINEVPSDTTLRERLDPVDPQELQGAIDKLIAKVQRAKILEQFRCITNSKEGGNDYIMVAIDGTTYFSSNKIHCEHCLVKKHQNGTVEYHHQLLAAVVVSPTLSQVLPIMLEPISKQDGTTKNDCEVSAIKRLLVKLRTKHPHLKIGVCLDALFGSQPVIQLLNELDIRYIINFKRSDNKSKYLFDAFDGGIHKKEVMVNKSSNITRKYTYHNNLPLNYAHRDVMVNYIDLEETILTNTKKNPQKSKTTTFGWITDLEISNTNVNQIGEGGRARWRIENETFNTQKNLNYNFEHNYGHGNKNLSIVMVTLMFIMFLINQIEALCCPMFQAAHKKARATIILWEDLRNTFKSYLIECWEHIYLWVAGYKRLPSLADVLDTT